MRQTIAADTSMLETAHCANPSPAMCNSTISMWWREEAKRAGVGPAAPHTCNTYVCQRSYHHYRLQSSAAGRTGGVLHHDCTCHSKGCAAVALDGELVLQSAGATQQSDSSSSAIAGTTYQLHAAVTVTE